MAYKRNEIYKQALEIAEDKDVYFIIDIIASLPISGPTFYEFFPPDSNEFNTIKEKLEHNKTVTKKKLRKRWNDDEAQPVLQIALYKLIGSEEESDRINSQKVKAVVSTEVTESIEKAFEGLDDEKV
jgi:hypothetical protein